MFSGFVGDAMLALNGQATRQNLLSTIALFFQEPSNVRDRLIRHLHYIQPHSFKKHNTWLSRLWLGICSVDLTHSVDYQRKKATRGLCWKLG